MTAFVAVCNTVAYAHARGVVHRDLKPANVVLGDYGEVIVLDWGLAKILGSESAAVPRGGDSPAEPVFIPATVAPPVAPNLTRDATQAGHLIGTPAYMAPEQVNGCIDLIDARTDVYGLGAMLYQLLTGRPPFVGEDTPAVLHKITHEKPQPPRQLVKKAPAALEQSVSRPCAKRAQPATRPAAPWPRISSSSSRMNQSRHIASRLRFVPRASWSWWLRTAKRRGGSKPRPLSSANATRRVMQSMTSYQAGDLVLVHFPLTANGPGKPRPALVILDTGDADVVLARVTTQPRSTSFDIPITEWKKAGLLAPSIIRLHKLASLAKSRTKNTSGPWTRQIERLLPVSCNSWRLPGRWRPSEARGQVKRGDVQVIKTLPWTYDDAGSEGGRFTSREVSCLTGP